MSCKKAQGSLAEKRVTILETTDASKNRIGREEALALTKQVDRIVAARSGKVVVLDLKRAKPSEEEILAVLLGPSGNLRAPTIRRGKILLVGFNEEAYREVLG